jgi:serine protease inhibitor
MGLTCSSVDLLANHIYDSIAFVSEKLYPLMGKNYVFSPLSICYTLSLLQLASVSHTHKELNTLLGRTSTLDDLFLLSHLFNTTEIQLVTAIFTQKLDIKTDSERSILNSITNIIDIKTDSSLSRLNSMTNIIDIKINSYFINNIKDLAFISEDASVDDINCFIKEKTNGLITNMINDDEIKESLIVANTIYFRMDWKIPFEKTQTTNAYFNHIFMPMMSVSGSFGFYENLTMQTVRLLYQNTDYCMDIILPHSDINHCKQHIDHIIYQNIMITIKMPRFTHRQQINLIPYLIQLGINDLFDNQCRLDHISKSVFVSKLIHETVVIVEETGTTAASSTFVQGNIKSARIPHKIFIVDRPFIYCIRYLPKNILLFVGDYHGY